MCTKLDIFSQSGNDHKCIKSLKYIMLNQRSCSFRKLLKFSWSVQKVTETKHVTAILIQPNIRIIFNLNYQTFCTRPSVRQYSTLSNEQTLRLFEKIFRNSKTLMDIVIRDPKPSTKRKPLTIRLIIFIYRPP